MAGLGGGRIHHNRSLLVGSGSLTLTCDARMPEAEAIARRIKSSTVSDEPGCQYVRSQFVYKSDATDSVTY